MNDYTIIISNNGRCLIRHVRADSRESLRQICLEYKELYWNVEFVFEGDLKSLQIIS